MSDHDDLQPDMPGTPLDPATEAALAELDRIGRHAGLALRSAVATIAPPAASAPSTGPISGNGSTAYPTTPVPTPTPTHDVEPVVVELRHAPSGGRPRTRRLVLAAAAVAAVAGVAAAQLLESPTEPVQLSPGDRGAPTAVIGDEGGGIYPPEATDRVLEVASPEFTEVWDQWSLSLPPAGRHLLLELRSGDTSVVEVLPDLGAAPLQAARVDSDEQLPGSGETAVFGVVDNVVDGAGLSQVTVERPGAAPIELHVEVLEGATHNAFVGFVPGDLGPGAEVVAYDPAGAEVRRAPIAESGGEDPDDGLYPDDPTHPRVSFGPDEPGDTGWGGQVTTGGHYVVLGATGQEDSVNTVIERPATQPLQVLATHLNGTPGGAKGVYGLVTTDAKSVELEVPGADPLPLGLVPIDGATHEAFGGWPSEEGLTDLDGAVVVARDPGGAEIARRPLEWTRYDVVP